MYKVARTDKIIGLYDNTFWRSMMLVLGYEISNIHLKLHVAAHYQI